MSGDKIGSNDNIVEQIFNLFTKKYNIYFIGNTSKETIITTEIKNLIQGHKHYRYGQHKTMELDVLCEQLYVAGSNYTSDCSDDSDENRKSDPKSEKYEYIYRIMKLLINNYIEELGKLVLPSNAENNSGNVSMGIERKQKMNRRKSVIVSDQRKKRTLGQNSESGKIMSGSTKVSFNDSHGNDSSKLHGMSESLKTINELMKKLTAQLSTDRGFSESDDHNNDDDDAILKKLSDALKSVESPLGNRKLGQIDHPVGRDESKRKFLSNSSSNQITQDLCGCGSGSGSVNSENDKKKMRDHNTSHIHKHGKDTQEILNRISSPLTTLTDSLRSDKEKKKQIKDKPTSQTQNQGEDRHDDFKKILSSLANLTNRSSSDKKKKHKFFPHAGETPLKNEDSNKELKTILSSLKEVVTGLSDDDISKSENTLPSRPNRSSGNCLYELKTSLQKLTTSLQ